MYALTDLLFWVSFLGFILAVFVSFYIPGFLIARKVDSKISVRLIVLSLCLGYVLWTVQGYIFGYLQIRWVSYIYLFISILLFLPYKKHVLDISKYILTRIKEHKFITAFILLGIILQTQYMFGSGIITSSGMLFHGVNSVDGLMHMGYIQKMISMFPPNEPGAYYLTLKNYHYWMDLNIAELARVWVLPSHHIFFQFMPIFFSVVTASAAFVLMRQWTKSSVAGFWALFFLFFAGDAAYIFMLILHQTFGFYTPVIDNGMTQFYNMPHAAAKMIFIAGLSALYQWIKTKKNEWGLIVILLFAPLVGFKVYFGLFAGLGITLLVVAKLVVTFVKNKKTKIAKRIITTLKLESFALFMLLLFAIIAGAIFIPPNSNAGGLAYYPLEWPKLFLNSDNLDLREWWLRMQVYEAAGNVRNIFIYNAFAIIIGLLCIHGTRVIGFIPHKNLVKKLGWEHMVFFIPGIIVFHILGLTTLQKVGSFNVFNFFVVSTVIMAFFSAYLLYELSNKKKWWAYALIFIIVLITIPSSVNQISTATIANYQGTGAVIPTAELRGLQYIRNNSPTRAIVQAHPKNSMDNVAPYVAYFTNRDSYAAGIDVVSAHNHSTKPNHEQLLTAFSIQNEKVFAETLKKMGIDYIYLQNSPEQKLPFEYNAKYLTKVFDENGIQIYQIK